MKKYVCSEPRQPPQSSWQFIQELQTPLHQNITWSRLNPRPNEVRLDSGVTLHWNFPDPQQRLVTAYRDFERFLDKGKIARREGYRIVTGLIRADMPEMHRVEVTKRECRILAGDTEGIRRGLVFIEDQILRAGGPFLPVDIIERKPFLRTRLSRCFYGPIKRPPHNRDELADDVNYYPDEYLNRLAHDGVNALWLVISFKEAVPSRIIPEYGRDSARRLAKLRLTVERCARYGIRIYPLCTEPAPFSTDSTVLKAHPELGGHRSGNLVHFCVSNRLGQAYLEEATRTLFSEAPGLGGLIVISVGESESHCYSFSAVGINCPRCSQRKPWEVMADAMSAMERGMHAVNPDTELISWPYGQFWSWETRLIPEAAAYIPKGVILQHNFESSLKVRQLGKWRQVWDYWLSLVGPSQTFRDAAKAALAHGNRVFAKLQVGCSHEVASVPFVPVPGILYQKYRAMRRLGISGVMQCWYFGSYPSLMTKAAGELSMEPFPSNKRKFLLDLARRDWPRHAAQVVKAWDLFEKGYGNVPAHHFFGWYGPLHDGPVWPLYLEPKNLPLAPTWELGYPPSGDQVGECAPMFTPDEVVELCARIVRYWMRGVALLKRLIPFYINDRERMKDINVAIALGIQFQSAYNIFRFYTLREKLAYAQNSGQRRTLLSQMKAIVKHELKNDGELLALLKGDSRLGFHSESEGYRYFPAKIKWRMNQLNILLGREFPKAAGRINRKTSLFPQYTGEAPGQAAYPCSYLLRPPEMNGKLDDMPWVTMPAGECRNGNYHVFADMWDGHGTLLQREGLAQHATQWKAGYDRKALYIGVICKGAIRKLMLTAQNSRNLWEYEGYDYIRLHIKPSGIWPAIEYSIMPGNPPVKIVGRGDDITRNHAWTVVTHINSNTWSITARIPFASLGVKVFMKRPIRFNIERMVPFDEKGALRFSWIRKSPLKGRLVWGNANPNADYGWLLFKRY